MLASLLIAFTLSIFVQGLPLLLCGFCCNLVLGICSRRFIQSQATSSNPTNNALEPVCSLVRSQFLITNLFCLDRSLHGTTKLVSYFAVLNYCLISRQEKEMVGCLQSVLHSISCGGVEFLPIRFPRPPKN